jgi:hypothetical protein
MHTMVNNNPFFKMDASGLNDRGFRIATSLFLQFFIKKATLISKISIKTIIILHEMLCNITHKINNLLKIMILYKFVLSILTYYLKSNIVSFNKSQLNIFHEYTDVFV